MIHSIAKALCLTGALTGAAALSQYPAFAQQYTQRLAGHVDALTEVVADFDVSALEAGLTRTEALTEMTGTPFLEARAADMQRTFARQIILTDQLARLRSASPLARITLATQLRDPETLQATWADFEPALPMSMAGAVTGAGGFLTGWVAIAALLGLLRRIFRPRVVRRPARTSAPVRVDPPLYRTETGPQLQRPRLMGETRP